MYKPTRYHLYPHLPISLNKIPPSLQPPTTISTTNYFHLYTHLSPSLHPPTTISTPTDHHFYTHLLPYVHPPWIIDAPTYHHANTNLPIALPPLATNSKLTYGPL